MVREQPEEKKPMELGPKITTTQPKTQKKKKKLKRLATTLHSSKA